jgi:glycosyltransferase involved in cell wall biosynthesis
MEKKDPEVSVVIASHRKILVVNCIDSLLKQVPDTASYEIIVVADYNIDELCNLFPSVKWVYFDSRSISAKRNIGISHSSAEIIAFIDDDCRAGSDWIKNGLSYLKSNPQIGAVEGKTTIENVKTVNGTHREYRRLEKQGFRTNNIFYRKVVLNEAGGFDERFTVQREDIDLAFTVIKNGHRFDYNESIKVEHKFRDWEKWDLLKNCINRRFDPLLFRKHPSEYRKFIRSPFPASIILLLLLHSAALLSFLTNYKIARLMILTDLAAVLYFSLKRTGLQIFQPKRFLYELTNVILAPFVLALALIYGSIKFRKRLFF